MNEKEKQIPLPEDFLPEEPPLAQEIPGDMPQLILSDMEEPILAEEAPIPELEPVILFPEPTAE
jgi:hypothetical protein